MPNRRTAQYYHGGQRDLAVGSYIQPPSETGVAATSDYRDLPGISVIRRDRVYVTTDSLVARLFAAMHPSGGMIYVVEPEGPLENDPDCTVPGISFECLQAKILSRVRLTGRQKRMVWKAMGL